MKPSPKGRTALLRFKLEEAERKQMMRAAKRAGKTFSEWARTALSHAVRYERQFSPPEAK